MSSFYDDFKFAVESCGLPAPTSEFFNTPMIALTSLGTACGALETMGTNARSFPLQNFVAYCVWLRYINMNGIVGNIKPVHTGARAGQAAIAALKNMPKGTIIFRAGAYIGGCAAAAYFGVLVGACLFAIQQKVFGSTGDPGNLCYYIFENGGERDRETARLEAELNKKKEEQMVREVQRLKELQKKLDKMFETNPNLC
jgi:hypothetical protein